MRHFATSVLLRSYIKTLITVIGKLYLKGPKSQRCTGKLSKPSPGGGTTEEGSLFHDRLTCYLLCVAVIIGEYVKTERQ